jgi:hypothetical protein
VKEGAGRWKVMEGEEYMNRKQQEAEIAEVSILIIIIITRHSKKVTITERKRRDRE